MKTELKGIDAKVAIHCTTPELYTQVLDLFPINAEKRKLMDFGFDKYGNETCIADYGLCYGRIDFWKSEGYTIITAADFIAMNTEPEAAPAWSFKTDEELKNFVATFLATKGDFEQFLSSLRKPAFELITTDNVKVTDKNQGVWIINGEQIVQYDAFFVGTRQCFSTRDAAISHIRNTAKVLCLDDWGPHNLLRKDVAEHLVNERIK